MTYALFVDLDGVLADFDRAVEEITGLPPSQQSPKAMWPRIAKTPGFYENLHWTPDGRDLWDYIAAYNPVVLTGLPRGSWAEPQKLAWCRRELGTEVPVITCMSREKPQKAAEWLSEHRSAHGVIPLLIDDRAGQKAPWEEAGGVFVHHTATERTLAALAELGL
ncbi:MAG: hypothetical protein ACQETQ_01515 [Spirochaetota bacterium]